MGLPQALCARSGCDRLSEVSRRFRCSRAHRRAGAAGVAAYHALQASGEAAQCPPDCRWRCVALENAEETFRAAHSAGLAIPWSEAEARSLAQAGPDGAEPLDALLQGLGQDILDEPVPPHLLALLDPPPDAD